MRESDRERSSQTSRDLSAKKHSSRRISINRYLVEEEDEGPKSLGRRFIDDWCFNGIVYIGIVVNSVQMGLELQFKEGGWKIVWLWMEQFFCFFFLVEMLCKLWGLGREYFTSKANWVDFVVVVVAVLDNWILPLTGANLDKLEFVGMLRMVRLARILKLLKAKRDLMILIEGILSSIKSMFWLSVLLAILIYTISICFVKFIGESDAYPDDGFDNKQYFGDMASACLTALNLALLEDWGDVVRPVLKHQPLFAFMIMAYVAISCFGLMNAIIGVIVEHTSATSEEARQDDLAKFRALQMQFVEEIKDIVYEIDTDGDGTVSPEEIALASHNEELNQALEMVDLPLEFHLEEVHAMLDKDGDGELTKEEFRIGMHRLIFSNEFQRQCLLMLGMAQQKRKSFQHQQEAEHHFSELEALLKALPAKIAAELPSKRDIAEAVVKKMQYLNSKGDLNLNMSPPFPSNYQYNQPPVPTYIETNDKLTMDADMHEKLSTAEPYYDQITVPSGFNVAINRGGQLAQPAWNQAAAWENLPPPNVMQPPVLTSQYGEVNVAIHPPPIAVQPPVLNSGNGETRLVPPLQVSSLPQTGASSKQHLEHHVSESNANLASGKVFSPTMLPGQLSEEAALEEAEHHVVNGNVRVRHTESGQDSNTPTSRTRDKHLSTPEKDSKKSPRSPRSPRTIAKGKNGWPPGATTSNFGAHKQGKSVVHPIAAHATLL